MSYYILYRSLFVLLPDGSYIPFVESGDNNVWSTNYRTGREQRSRDFETWCFGERKLSYTRQEIEDWLAKKYVGVVESARLNLQKDPGWCIHDTAEEEATRRFGWYNGCSIYGQNTHGTTWGQFRNFFRKAMENAVPYDIFSKHVGLTFTWCKGDGTSSWERKYVDGTPDEVRRAWDETVALIGGTPWICVRSEYNARIISDLKSSCRSKGRFVLVKERRDDGTVAEKYVTSFFPLETSALPSRARRFRMNARANTMNTMSDIIFSEEGRGKVVSVSFRDSLPA